MTTEYVKLGVNPETDAAHIARAAEIIRDGGLVGMPTETVYGLGASAFSAEAAGKIYAAKGRPSDNPLIVHVSEPAEAENIAYVSPLYYKLAAAFMPGPLTVIMPKKDTVPSSVTGGLASVAVRCPSHKYARALIRAAGVPIAAPSANRSGSPSPTTAQHVLADMDGRIEMILDGGPCEIGLESTVIKLTDDGCIILRPGAVTEIMLARVCGTVEIARAVTDPAEAGEKPLSPGMKYKHYAPRAEVVLVEASDDVFEMYVKANIAPSEAVAVPDDLAHRFVGLSTLSAGQTASATAQSHSLFALLRRADEIGCSRIYMKLPPASGEYLALYNRLIRASGGKIVHVT